MVYAGKIGDKKYSLGVSGRLKDSNLIMWDEETNSLWSQIKGEALYGKSKGKKLGMLPAIFVGLGTWKRMHQETLVLDLSNVRARSWFYKTDDLAKGVVNMRTMMGGQRKAVLGIGLRHKGVTLCVAMPMLHDKGLVQADVGGVPLLVVWDKKAPADWDFEKYNKDVAAMWNFLEQSGAGRQVIPYKENRVIVFNSDLLHGTDTIRFRSGYENRRINITLLYGERVA